MTLTAAFIVAYKLQQGQLNAPKRTPKPLKPEALGRVQLWVGSKRRQKKHPFFDSYSGSRVELYARIELNKSHPWIQLWESPYFSE